MNIFNDIQPVRQQLLQWKKQGESIAFVPTMGNLHAGHIRLVEQAAEKADRVVVSIFVNPLQFNEASDFSSYPRTFEQDIEQLEKVSVDAVFAPSDEVLYPAGQDTTTKVFVPGLSDILEGKCRPGHFTGVTTIVNKLFNIVQPDIACFGEKDFQQLMLIRHMVNDLDMPVIIEAVATCREQDGLAMSSRNNRLDAQQRVKAAEIFQVLSHVTNEIARGNQDFSRLEQDSVAALDQSGFTTEYVVIRRVSDLGLPAADDRHLIVLVAARLGDIRLIDNMTVSTLP